MHLSNIIFANWSVRKEKDPSKLFVGVFFQLHPFAHTYRDMLTYVEFRLV